MPPQTAPKLRFQMMTAPTDYWRYCKLAAELGDDEMTVTITIASTDYVGAQDISVKRAADFAENKAATAIKNDPAAPATTTTVVKPDAAPGVPTSVNAAAGIGEVTA